MIPIKRFTFFILLFQVLISAGVSFSQDSMPPATPVSGGRPSDKRDDSTKNEGDERFVLVAPESREIGYGNWDAAVTGGQVPSWAYLVTLRGKSTEEARIIRTSWEQNSSFANSIYFFNSGNLTKERDLPWTPPSVKGWGSDEAVVLSFGAGGDRIGYHHIKYGPIIQARRDYTLVEDKIFDQSGNEIGTGKYTRRISRGGRFGWGLLSVFNLESGESTPLNGGSPLFSQYDDSYVIFFSDKGELEYYDSNGRVRWNASIGPGPARNVVISPGGRYVFAAAGNKEWEDVVGVIDASGKKLWAIPVLLGIYSAAFSQDGRYLALVTRDANWLFESATGKIMAKISMPKIFGDEKVCPNSSKVYVFPEKQHVVVITGTIRNEKSCQAIIPGYSLGPGADVVYEYSPEGGRIITRLPNRPFIPSVVGMAYEPDVTLSADGHWLYYLTMKGLFVRHLE